MHPAAPARHGALGRLADAAFVHRRRVLAGWLAVLTLAAVAAVTLGGSYTADYRTPGSDSAAASDRLEHAFGGRSADQVDIVWKDAHGATAPAVKARIGRLLQRAGAVPGLVPGTTFTAAEISPDGRTGIVRLPLDRPATAVASASGTAIVALVRAASGDGLQVAAKAASRGSSNRPA